MKDDLVKPSSSMRFSVWDLAILATMLAPGPVVFAAYVIWVVHNGGDPYTGHGLLTPPVYDLSLTARNVCAIVLNGMFNAIVASILGIMTSMMIGFMRAAKEDPAAPYRWHDATHGGFRRGRPCRGRLRYRS